MDSTVSSDTFADVSYMRAPRTESNAGNDLLDIVDMYGELGHQEHVLDLTNFDGEDDTRLPGETQLSYRLRKEGKIRRAKTKKTQGALLPKLDLGHHTVEADDRLSSSQAPPVSHSFPRSHTHSQGLESLRSPSIPPLSPWSPRSSSPVTPQTHAAHSFLYADPGGVLSSASPVSLTPSSQLETPVHPDAKAKRATHHSRRHSRFDMDEAEAEDMPIVAERARPGRAKIDRIVADEAGCSRGAMIVACEFCI